MSTSLHVILRCDVRADLAQPGPDGRTSERCTGYRIGRTGQSVPEVREAAALSGWKREPGKPYPHIGGKDICPDHAKEAP